MMTKSEKAQLCAILVGLVVCSVGADLLLVARPARSQVADSADSLTVRLAKPVSATRDSRANLYRTDISSSAWTEFPATDIPKSLRNSNNAQELVLSNIDSAAKICVMQLPRIDKLVDGGPTPDCAKILDAGVTLETCGANAPDGGSADYVVTTGTSRPMSIAGDDCIFLRSDTSNGDAIANLIVR